MLKTLMSRVLLLWGIAFSYMGVSWIVAPTKSRLEGISWMPFINEQVVGCAWLLAGLCALVGAFWRRTLPPLAAVPTLIPILIALIFLGAYITTGNFNRLSSVVAYASMGASIWVVGGWSPAYLESKWFELGEDND